MHGRPRQRAAGETSGAENDKELAKVAELQELIPSVLHNHRTCWYWRVFSSLLSQPRSALAVTFTMWMLWFQRRIHIEVHVRVVHMGWLVACIHPDLFCEISRFLWEILFCVSVLLFAAATQRRHWCKMPGYWSSILNSTQLGISENEQSSICSCLRLMKKPTNASSRKS